MNAHIFVCITPFPRYVAFSSVGVLVACLDYRNECTLSKAPTIRSSLWCLSSFRALDLLPFDPASSTRSASSILSAMSSSLMSSPSSSVCMSDSLSELIESSSVLPGLRLALLSELVVLCSEKPFNIIMSEMSRAVNPFGSWIALEVTNSPTRHARNILCRNRNSKTFQFILIRNLSRRSCIDIHDCECMHRLIQGPVHPSFGLVKCTAGRVYPSNSASWTGNNPSKVH